MAKIKTTRDSGGIMRQWLSGIKGRTVSNVIRDPGGNIRIKLSGGVELNLCESRLFDKTGMRFETGDL